MTLIQALPGYVAATVPTDTQRGDTPIRRAVPLGDAPRPLAPLGASVQRSGPVEPPTVGRTSVEVPSAPLNIYETIATAVAEAATQLSNGRAVDEVAANLRDAVIRGRS